MRCFSRLAQNSLWLLIARVGAQAGTVIVTLLLARRLGSSGFGEYAFIAAAIMICNTLTTFGTDMFVIREIAGRAGHRQLSSALLIQLVSSAILIAVIWIGAPVLPRQTADSILALKIYSLALIPLAFFTIFTSILRGEQQMGFYSWLQVTISVMQAAGIWLFIPSGASVVSLAHLLLWVQTAGAVIGGILCYFQDPGFWRSPDFSANGTVSLLVSSAPIAAIAILRILYQRLGFIMLALLSGAAITGWYSAAARATEAARMGHGAVFTALFPLMSQAAAEGRSDAVRVFKIPLLMLLILAGGVSIVLNVFAKPIVDIFYGAQFQPSLSALRILSLTLIPYTINDFLSISFLAAKMEKPVVRILLLGLLTLVILSCWLIPRAGHLGASWAVLIAEMLQSCLLLFAWKFKLDLKLRQAAAST